MGSSTPRFVPCASEREFTDIEECWAAFRATHLDFIPFARPAAKSSLGTAELGKLTLWWGHVAARGAGLGAMPAGSMLLVACGNAGRGWRINREPLTSRSIALLPSRAEYACVLPAASWIALAVPSALLDAHRRAAQEAGMPSFKRACVVELGDGARRVRQALFAAREHVMRDPSLLDDSGVRPALQRTLLDALLDAIPAPAALDRPDHRLLARLVHYLRTHRAHPVWVSDLCAALATTPRSLRRLFAQAFGITPARYLRLRRMHLARRALLAGEFASVTAAAVHFGFFDLGRFSAAHRALFGEVPSAALRRSGAQGLG